MPPLQLEELEHGPEPLELLPTDPKNLKTLYSFCHRCLGTHPPAYGRLPPNTLVLHMSGSYFSAVSIESRAVSENFIPRYLHIGTPDDCQVNLKII